MKEEKFPMTCPLCGRKHEIPLENLSEGATIQCPHCQVKLNLHGHMWEEIQGEIAKMKQES